MCVLYINGWNKMNSRPNVILSTSTFQKASWGHSRGTNVLESFWCV